MSAWGASLVGYASTIELLQDLQEQFGDDAVFVVGPTVNYAVNRMPHRPEIGRKQNGEVSGESYATMKRYLDSPCVVRAWHDLMQTVRSSARAATARCREQSSTSTGTATRSSRGARSAGALSSVSTNSTRWWKRRTARKSARAVTQSCQRTTSTSTRARRRATGLRHVARSVTARGKTTASTGRTASAKLRMGDPSRRGCGSARLASRSCPSTADTSTSGMGSSRSTASPARHSGETNHGAQMTASPAASGGSSRRTGSWRQWSDVPTVGTRRSRLPATTSSHSPTAARRCPATSSRPASRATRRSTTRRRRSGTSGRTSTTQFGGRRSPTTSKVVRQSRGNGQTARTVERRRERYGSDKRPRVPRTLVRVKRYAELRGNSENSRIKSRLGNINWYHELGTSKMEARPFARPAAERVNATTGSAIEQFLDEPLLQSSTDAVVRATALAVKREMQRIIKQKNIWDTGNLHGSTSIERIQ